MQDEKRLNFIKVGCSIKICNLIARILPIVIDENIVNLKIIIYISNRQTWHFVTKIVLTYCEKKNCSRDREFFLKFEAEGQEFAKILRSLKQFLRTVKGQNTFFTYYWMFLRSNKLEQLEFNNNNNNVLL